MAETFDLLIKGASVADGTGNPRYRSDIGISGRRIAAIERNIKLSSAKKVLRAGGRVVCPGFIDTHTHDDLYLLVKPTCDDKILQGVTTVALGNCGLSPGPVSPKHQEEMAAFLSVAGTKHLEEEDLNIGTFEDWLAKLESVKPGINVMSLVGHITIRIAVMGIENRPPTKREMAAMKKLTAASMESGAYGLSSGLIYAPGNYAETAEITELAKVAARYNGIYTTHLRNESDFIVSALTEALEIGKNAAIPVHISHHKVLGKQNWGGCGETLRLIAEARNGGLTVTCDQYPYQAASTFLHAALPPGILAHGDRVFTEILRDPDARTELTRQIENSSEKGWENLIRGAGFEGIYIAVAGKHEHYVGKSVADIAETEDKNPYDVVFDLLAEEERGVVAIFFMINEDDI
ncbi:MAG: amidohydrolase family protein, partial [Proteobacteria bacterium]|nr:amidohydrolase family protein [Pseudomonadota bacterium]